MSTYLQRPPARPTSGVGVIDTFSPATASPDRHSAVPGPGTSPETTLGSLEGEAFLQTLGLRVRRSRLDAGLSRRALALRSGVSERYLAQLESGQGNMSIILLRKVSSAIEQPLHQLLDECIADVSHELA